MVEWRCLRKNSTYVSSRPTPRSSLFIPDNAKEKPLEAVVIAIGSGKRLDNGTIQAITVKAGDKILIGKYTGSEVKLDGQDHIILSEDDVLAVLEG